MAEPTKWKLFASNEETWYSMLTDCARAKESIVLEQFIFVNDDFGQKLINVCAERAKEGVKVRFLWDAAGSFTFFGTNIIQELKGKGVELLFWKTLIPSYFRTPNFRSWYVRNHRRTLVIDDTVGYTGSICVRDSMRNWRDTNVRIEGAVVDEMSNAFERMWQRALKSRNLPKRRRARDPLFRYVTNGPAPGQKHMYRSVLEALSEARRSVYITTPYFIPTGRLLRSIKAAARRGVDVRILIPERSDHFPTLDLGARSFFTSLLEDGVRIFLYPSTDETIIHSKTITIDGMWGTVGSLNLDNASLLYNYEANLISLDSKFVQVLASHFKNDLEKSKEVTYQEWKSRFFVERIPEILIRVVRKFL